MIPNTSFHPQLQSPVSILSDDVLCYIFSLNALKTQESVCTTVSTSQVCRWWRYLALTYPELWRRYAFLDWVEGKGYGGFTSAVFARSQDCGIDVGWRRKEMLSSSQEPPSDAMSMCKWSRRGIRHTEQELLAELSHLGRIRSLFLPLFGGCMQGITASVCLGVQGAAPKLEELEVMAWPDFQRGLRILPGSFLEAPEGEMGDEGTEARGAVLKILSLKHCWINFDFGSNRIRLEALRSLEIVSTAHLDLTPSKPGSKWSDYLEVLAHCPSLRTLSLDFCRLAEEDEDEENVTKYPQVSLPHLQQFILKTRLYEIQRALKTLSFSKPCDLQISVSGFGPGCSVKDLEEVWRVVCETIQHEPIDSSVRSSSFPSFRLTTTNRM